MQDNLITKSKYQKSPAGTPYENSLKELNRLSECDLKVSAFRDVRGGGTGEEFVENLTKDGDRPGNKWYDGSAGETWIQADFNTPTRIVFLQLKSANDCPERDPYHVTFYVKKNKEEFKKIMTFDNLIWEKRYQLQDFNVDSLEEVDTFKIVIHKNRSFALKNNWESGTQLAQVIFYTHY